MHVKTFGPPATPGSNNRVLDIFIDDKGQTIDILINGVSVGAMVRSFDVKVWNDLIDVTTFGSTSKQYMSGLQHAEATLSLVGFTANVHQGKHGADCACVKCSTGTAQPIVGTVSVPGMRKITIDKGDL